MGKMTIIAATHNKNKLREFEELFGCRVFAAAELGINSDPEETGETFEENSEIKARAIYEELRAKGLEPEGDYWVIADDSGLCVDFLGGAPGVHSARYAATDGHNSDDRANLLKLLKEMEGVPENERGAAFHCVVTAINRDGTLIKTHGEMPGILTEEPRGENGFGYDPILYVPGKGRTSAELSPEEKNAISHRGKALRRLKEFI